MMLVKYVNALVQVKKSYIFFYIAVFKSTSKLCVLKNFPNWLSFLSG